MKYFTPTAEVNNNETLVKCNVQCSGLYLSAVMRVLDEITADQNFILLFGGLVIAESFP